MLDNDIKSQLRQHFAGLGHRIELVYDASDHEKQGELLELLNGLAETSDDIVTRESSGKAEVPRFVVHRDGEPTGIQFRGIPGGHEFTSLVLAILNAAGKGKLPDAGLQQRIKRIKASHRVTTYVSLSCENCPDVVQALNQVALAHSSLEHEMVEGSLVQGELESLGVQGVPAVFIDGQMVHSGRGSLAELIDKLEAHFGSDEGSAEPVDLGHFDVAVVGGGPAGVSAAIYSSRKGLRTALIAERLGGQVKDTKGIENMISVIYTEGPQLVSSMDQHLREYPIDVLEHRLVEKVIPSGTDEVRTELVLSSGETLTAESVVVATGAQWRKLNVPGEKDYNGRGVAYCPHCDGPFYKGKKVSVIGGGNSGVEAAIDLAGICSEVILFEFLDALKADAVLVEKAKSLPNVEIVLKAKTTEVIGDGEKVTAMAYEDRESGEARRVDLDAVFVQIGLSPNSAFLKDVVEMNRFGEIVVDERGRTSVPGIYAAGDVTTTPYKQIVIALGDGAKVALAAFEDRMRRVPSAAE